MGATTFQMQREEVRSVVEQILRELARVLGKHLPNPLKESRLKVPFVEDDVLSIRFPESVTLAYRAYQHSGTLIMYVFYARPQPAISYVELKFGGGLLLEVKDEIVGEHKTSSYLALSQLFTPEFIEAFESAEVSSKRGLAEKWFSELLDVVKHAAATGLMEAVNLQDIQHLFDTERTSRAFFKVVLRSRQVDEIMISADPNLTYADAYFRTLRPSESVFLKVMFGKARSLDGYRLDAVLDAARFLLDRFAKDVEKYLTEYVRSAAVTLAALRYMQI